VYNSVKQCLSTNNFLTLDCNLNVHRSQDSYRSHNCLNEIHDACLGTSQKKDKANDKLRRLRDRIRPEKDAKKRASNLSKLFDLGASTSHNNNMV